MLRLMCITAHPDDEAGGFGGTLLKYRERGVETSVICLTPGQAATHRGGARNDQELADMRRKEFAASCEILKVSRALILNYPDGQLYKQELNRVVYELTMRVREFRPQVMITFGPEGGVTGLLDARFPLGRTPKPLCGPGEEWNPASPGAKALLRDCRFRSAEPAAHHFHSRDRGDPYWGSFGGQNRSVQSAQDAVSALAPVRRKCPQSPRE
jgi:hypothetical protein